MRKYFYSWLAALSVVAVAGSASSSTHDFYKGKSIRFITAFSPGGAFDVYTRALARHYHKHVPGNPSSIVENMTGAAARRRAKKLCQNVQVFQSVQTVQTLPRENFLKRFLSWTASPAGKIEASCAACVMRELTLGPARACRPAR